MIGILILLLCLIMIAIILFRTAMFRPKLQETKSEQRIAVRQEKILSDFIAMIQCRTISNRETALEDRAEFEKFESLLLERFPLINLRCTKEKIGRTGIVYRLSGNSPDHPSVCMAHYDVVPVEEDMWEKPPFDGIVDQDVIWGRGTLDTKGTLCGIMEALEQLLEEGYIPKNDLYLSFSGEEEIDGESCSEIVSWLQNKGVRPAIVLDEGGAVVDHVFPGVSQSCALVGIGEKGSVNINFSMESQGGHASTPPIHSLLGQLSESVTRLEGHPFKRQLTKPVLEMFDTLGRHSTFLYRIIFANLWCFAPVLDIICKKQGGELNAMLRTTVAVTRMEGSKAYNVLPSRAFFGINMRLMGTDTIESSMEYLDSVIGNPNIRQQLVNGMNPSIYSDTNCKEWAMLTEVIRETWTDALVSPYLMMACSDSRHYCRITDRVYRFSAMALTKEERGMIHGHNERIHVNTLMKTVEFYIRFLKKI
ncbi:MAG: M20/M25/M40 family metallo-hydrolase [Lachnospiraceae bacterium]